MSQEAAEKVPGRWAERLGFPPVTGRVRFVGSTVLDALANGLMFAFLIVYFDRVTDLSLDIIGLALTIGRFLALLVPALVGLLLDRYGSKTLVAVGNAISCVGMLVCAVTTSAWQIVLVQFLIQSGTNVYWTCSRDLVAMVAGAQHRSRWFAMLSALRNVGTGFGSAVTAVSLAVASATGLRVVVAISAAAFVAAGLLLLTWTKPQQPKREHHHQDAAPAPASYLNVLRDGAYLRLLTVNLLFVLAAMVLPLLVTLWTVDYIGAGAWWAGVLVIINTALVALFSTLVVRHTERYRPRRMIQLALAVNAAAFLLFWAADGKPASAAIAILLAAMVLYTVAEIVGTPYMNDLSVELAPQYNQGRYYASFQLSWSLGMALAPALFTFLLSTGSFMPWVVMAALSLLVLPLTRVPRGTPNITPTAFARRNLTMPANTVLLLEAFGNSGEVLADAIRAEGFGVAVATHQQLYDNYSPCLKSKIDYLIIIDYADEQVVDHIIDAAQHHHVVGVLTGWEFFTGLCAEVAARLGLPGNDPSRSDAGRSKWAMAKAFDFGGVRHATTVHAADAVSLHGQIAAAVLDYPVVVKPTENAGSVGVTVVHRSSELDAAVAAAQAFPREFPHDIELDDSVLAQAYVGGREFSVESLASGGEIQHQAITEKATTEGAFRAETGHTIPAALTQEESTALTDAATAGLRALGFTNGAAHIEIKLCNGDAWVIEAGLRPAGDHIVKLVTHATGTDFARAYVRAVTGGPLPPPRPLQSQAGVRFLTPDTAGEVSAATICGPIPHGVIERGLLVDAGDHVGAVADNVSRLGYVIATANDRDQLEQALHAGLKSLDVSLR